MMLPGNNSVIGRCGTVCGRRTNEPASVPVVAVGLRIITQTDHLPDNVVFKPSLPRGEWPRARIEPCYSKPRDRRVDLDRCFLQACSLCRKEFGPDRDIYMYSGEGYCSIECRERKIEINEMGKLQESTQRMAASPGGRCWRRDHSPAANEVRLLREELRWRRDLVIAHKTRSILS
ncbi:hypothetical protein MLD38_030789 [Melastoma candidum]|uniref:Uncharacterized protein n=1 Tax=Melastoma candidum TaxID=119954 RepID=A0ACB9MPN1_9MYRT|nr:hypothetical protein MLD38_030789 [Melastoma candidum]